MRDLFRSTRLRLGALTAVGAALLLPLLAPTPALAWWRGGFGISIGLPPVVVAPAAPAYYPPPPVVAYAPPPARHPVWVPPHWQGPYWVPGHWA